MYVGMALCVFIPAFDKDGNIGRPVEGTLSLRCRAELLGEVIVVDNASNNRTGAEIKKRISHAAV